MKLLNLYVHPPHQLFQSSPSTQAALCVISSEVGAALGAQTSSCSSEPEPLQAPCSLWRPGRPASTLCSRLVHLSAHLDVGWTVWSRAEMWVWSSNVFLILSFRSWRVTFLFVPTSVTVPTPCGSLASGWILGSGFWSASVAMTTCSHCGWSRAEAHGKPRPAWGAGGRLWFTRPVWWSATGQMPETRPTFRVRSGPDVASVDETFY